MNRRTLAIRQFVAAALALLGVLFLVAKCTGCAQAPRAVGALDTVAYERELDECLKEGRAAKSLTVYTQCANEADKRHGVKDGGS